MCAPNRGRPAAADRGGRGGKAAGGQAEVPHRRAVEERGWQDLKPGQSDLFQIDARACLDLYNEYTAASGHEGGVRNYMYLYVEMWDKSGPEGAYNVRDGQSGAEHTSAIPDPMLLLRQGMLPPTATYRGSWTFSADTYADLLSYKVVRPYHRYWVQLDVTRIKACQYSSTTQCLNEVNWQSKVYNVDYWLQQKLRYYFKASCSIEKPCPAPQGPTSRMRSSGTVGSGAGAGSSIGSSPVPKSAARAPSLSTAYSRARKSATNAFLLSGQVR